MIEENKDKGLTEAEQIIKNVEALSLTIDLQMAAVAAKTEKDLVLSPFTLEDMAKQAVIKSKALADFSTMVIFRNGLLTAIGRGRPTLTLPSGIEIKLSTEGENNNG